jgi:MFS family permease
MLLFTVGAGLVLTAVAAASPGYWWFVAIFACGRPLLSATNGLAQVEVGEQTASADRAKAVALVAAGYGAGAGAIAIVHSLASRALGFRGVFALALVPLALLPLLRRWIQEPDRFAVAAAGSRHPIPVFGAVARPFRRRLAVIVVLAFAINMITGPANSFVFLFAQNFLHQPGVVTAGMVVGAGVTGLAGLLAGRWLADRVGRRLTGALAVVAVALLAVLAYSGSAPALVVGYILGVFCASLFAPALGALTTELFPTSVRASVVGWSLAAGVLGAVAGLLIFGSVTRAGSPFVVAGLLTFLPAVPVMGLFWLLPETRGREPEDLWPDLPRLQPHATSRMARLGPWGPAGIMRTRGAGPSMCSRTTRRPCAPAGTATGMELPRRVSRIWMTPLAGVSSERGLLSSAPSAPSSTGPGTARRTGETTTWRARCAPGRRQPRNGGRSTWRMTLRSRPNGRTARHEPRMRMPA